MSANASSNGNPRDEGREFIEPIDGSIAQPLIILEMTTDKIQLRTKLARPLMANSGTLPRRDNIKLLPGTKGLPPCGGSVAADDPYRSPRSNVLLKIAASRANSTSTVCPGCKSLSASAKALRLDVLTPPRARSRSPGLSPAWSAPDPGCTLLTRTPSPWWVMSGTIPVATRRVVAGAAGKRDCAAGALPEKFSGSVRAAR